MPVPLDYKDLLKILSKHKVRYLIVGAYAVTYYAEPRYTKDLDIWVEATAKNAEKLYSALKEFGAPLHNITIEDFTNEKLIYQIGVAPVRVDIIMGIKGAHFVKAWKKRVRAKLEHLMVNIIGLEDLIKSKEKSRRAQDKLDVKELKYTKRKKRSK